MEDRIKYVRKLSDKSYNRIMLDVQAIISGNWEGLDIKGLTGFPGRYRYRIGNIRIIFEKQGDTIKIIKVGSRGDIYK